MEKITNVSALNTTIATLSTIEGFDKEVIEKLEKMRDQFAKKSTALRKPTKTQEENEVLKTEILGLMTVGTKYTVSEVVTLLENKYSNQKISALLNSLAKGGELIKTEDKRKSFFELPTVEEE